MTEEENPMPIDNLEATTKPVDPLLLPRAKWVGVLRQCEAGFIRQAKSRLEVFTREPIRILYSYLYGSDLERFIENCGGIQGVDTWFIRAYPLAWKMICQGPQTRDETNFALMHHKQPIEAVETRVRNHFGRKLTT